MLSVLINRLLNHKSTFVQPILKEKVKNPKILDIFFLVNAKFLKKKRKAY